MIAYSYNPRTQETEAGDHHEFRARMNKISGKPKKKKERDLSSGPGQAAIVPAVQEAGRTSGVQESQANLRQCHNTQFLLLLLFCLLFKIW